MANCYDVIVIGSGPGGYVTAIRAAQCGFKTAIVEREHLGGVCLNWGCIPTKALLRSAEIKRFAEHAEDYGLNLKGSVEVNIKDIVARSRKVSMRLSSGVSFLMKKNKIDVIWGEAKLQKGAQGGRRAEVIVSPSSKLVMQPQNPVPKETLGYGTYQAKYVIIATGARPRIIPGIEPDGKFIWTYFESLIPETVPKSLLVMGSGAIGIELASFYHDMGAKVTIAEMMPQIMPVEDLEISTFVHRELEKKGIRILTEAKVADIKKNFDCVSANIRIKDKTEIVTADRVISAVGVQGNTENLGLEALGVKIDRGCIVTDEWGWSGVEGIYAIGDVAGPPMLAHKAEKEGVICIERIAGLKTVHPLDKRKIPGCTYCTPQVASVGLSEVAAKESGYDIRVGRCSFSANGRAIALGEDRGLIKTIFDKETGQLLGAHMVGAEVTELIQGFVVAMNLETTEEELMSTVFPHPTLSEMLKESVLDSYDRGLSS